jgi:hypothetical protein
MTFSIDGSTYTNTTGIFSGVVPGDYYVTAKSTAGCVSPQSVKQTINAAPTAPAAPTACVTAQPTCTVATGTITVSSSIAGLTFSIDGSTYTNTTGIFSGVVPGDYYVTAKNVAGCVSPQSLKQTINAAPLTPTVIAASVTPTSVIGSGQVIFSATASFGSIKWFDEATNGTEVLVLDPIITTTTTYYAEAISSEGCVSVSRTAVTATVISQGTSQLSYRFANPRIHKVSGTDRFEFEVQVKADDSGTEFLKGNVNLIFNNSTLSSNVADWIATPVSGSVTDLSISGTFLNIELDVPNSLAINTSYHTLITISGKITNGTGEAGIDFNEGNMNGKQFNKLAVSPGMELYQSPNSYDEADFVNTWVGRVYAIKYGWTQMVSLNWAMPVNTSIWEGFAGVSNLHATNVRIHKAGLLAIPSDGQLTVSGNTDIIPENGLMIESDAFGTGSLITGTSSGSAIAQRYMTTDAWHIVASPVSGQSIAGFLASNPNVAEDVVDASIRGMMDYNPELNEWNDYFTNSQSGSLVTGKGFSMRTTENGIVSFAGTLQSGNQQATGLSPDLWSCIGNPYTSAIGINDESTSSSDNFIVANTANLHPSFGAIYVWDQPDASNGTWGLYTVISNASPAFDVQQGQAFMVKMNTSATNIDFNSNMQFHGPALALKSTKGVWPTIKLQASGNSGKSSTIIAFNSRMTKGLDPTYDAGLLKGGSDLMVYSKLVEDNGIPFAIQALPTNDYDHLIIPIGLDFKTGGEVIFSAEVIDLSLDCRVILEDKLSKTFTDLSQKDYTATIAASSSVSDRFRLHTSYLTTGLDTETMAEKLSAYAIRNTEMIVRGEVSSQAVASVYDVQGRLVLTKKLDAGNRNSLRLPMIKTGIYMLYVKDNGKVQGFKVPVKE